ncbi:hypothetical protein ACM0CQ_15770 [Mycobacteroides abscessus subsp. abscessus]|uniref:hypothetical protein n=1 Tax=Mycobacteroides abscessus TaxID=36809 RepID=UPI0039EE20CB
MMSDAWSVKLERSGTLGETAVEWDRENCCVNGYDPSCVIQTIAWLIEDMWPDVVAETAAWARGALGGAQ